MVVKDGKRASTGAVLRVRRGLGKAKVATLARAKENDKMAMEEGAKEPKAAQEQTEEWMQVARVVERMAVSNDGAAGARRGAMAQAGR